MTILGLIPTCATPLSKFWGSWIDDRKDTELYVIADFLDAIVDVPVRGPVYDRLEEESMFT